MLSAQVIRGPPTATAQHSLFRDAVATHATPDSSGLAEYDCSNPATTGTFKLTTSCTLSAEVVVSGTLTIIGQTEDMNNLVTITAKSASRHFQIEFIG